MTNNVISIVQEFWSDLEVVIREGGRQLIQTALEEEVNLWIQAMSHLRDEKGRRQVKRNGYLPARKIFTGIGPIELRQPRVRNTQEAQFTSNILPRYMRKVPSQLTQN